MNSAKKLHSRQKKPFRIFKRRDAICRGTFADKFHFPLDFFCATAKQRVILHDDVWLSYITLVFLSWSFSSLCVLLSLSFSLFVVRFCMLLGVRSPNRRPLLAERVRRNKTEVEGSRRLVLKSAAHVTSPGSESCRDISWLAS